MSTIKVLHVIARMNVGGTAKYVSELVENISDSALATGFVQGAEIEDHTLERLSVFRVQHLGREISPVNDFKAWLELRKLVRILNPQIIHTHTFKAGLIGRLIGGNHKRVHTFHGHLFNDHSFSTIEKRSITVVEKFLAKRTDLLISVGEKVGVELRAAGIGATKEWISIPPGVTPLSTVNKSMAKELLGLKEDQLLVGWMARMVAVKNPYLLLEVAKRLPSLNFVMAGGGELLPEIANMAPTNVTVIGWADASTFWSAVDCAISTSDNEGMPIALIEAQLAGLPVIATDVGSNAEVVQNGVSGLICNKDVDSIVEALQGLMSNKELLRAMGRDSKLWANSSFKPEKMIMKHVQSYERLS